MACETCGEKPKNTSKDFTKAVIEIENPETLVLLRKVVIPASMGNDIEVPATIGKYHNVILYYEANKHVYIYSSDGIPTLITPDASGGIPSVVQTTGTSTDDVMSQNATTSMVFNDPERRRRVQIGRSSLADSDNNIAVGNSAIARAEKSIAIGGGTEIRSDYSTALGALAKVVYNTTHGTALGFGATVNAGSDYSVALGSFSSTSRAGEVNVGTGGQGVGYNSTNYRVIGGVHEPVEEHDAATKGYVDGVNSYSTTETLTGGTWIDGSPIYKKTIDTGTLPNNSSNLVSHGISDLKRILKVEGWAYNPTTTFTIASSDLQSGNDAFVISVPNKIGWQTNQNLTAYTESYVTMYYTKSA